MIDAGPIPYFLDRSRPRANPDYLAFLASKVPRAHASGIEPSDMPAHLFDFQAACTAFAVKQGRTGLYLSTGLGKTRIQLEWSRQCSEAVNGYALILTPLAVAKQIEREALALGYEARVIREQIDVKPGINICNYDRLDKLDPDAFGSVSLDEGGIIKSFGGKTTTALIEAFKAHRFRMSATATPAPNDHMELGNQAEFLGMMRANEMLMRWFINDTAEASQKWRLKKHAEQDFWNWLCSWSRVATLPSDITGNPHDDARFSLPPLRIVRHRANNSKMNVENGGLFGGLVTSATTMFDIKRQTQTERIKAALAVIEASWKPNNPNASPLMRDAARDTQTIPNTGQGGSQETINGSAKHTLPIPNTGQNSNGTTPKSTPNNQTLNATSIGSGDIKLASPNMRHCLPLKAEDARSAESLTNFTSITATGQNAFEASCAIDAIGASAISETTPKVYGAPPSTSGDWWIIWTDTNGEQDALARALGDRAVSIQGSQPSSVKEELHEIWLSGQRKILISKVSIFGFGMNWAHCCQMIFLGRSFSYESYYQAVRRSWRFGQKRPVDVHLIVAEGEDQIGRVIDRKAADHDRMKAAMTLAMRRSVDRAAVFTAPYNPTHHVEVPAWLTSAV